MSRDTIRSFRSPRLLGGPRLLGAYRAVVLSGEVRLRGEDPRAAYVLLHLEVETGNVLPPKTATPYIKSSWVLTAIPPGTERWETALMMLGLTRYDDDPYVIASLAPGRHIGVVLESLDVNGDDVLSVRRFVSWGDVDKWMGVREEFR